MKDTPSPALMRGLPQRSAGSPLQKIPAFIRGSANQMERALWTF